MKLELSHYKQNKMREREGLHLLRDIVVTAPVFHFETSWSNTDARSNTEKERVQQERKNNPPHKHNNKTFQR